MARRKPDIKELVDLNIRSIKDTEMRYLMYDMITKIKQVWEYQERRIAVLEDGLDASIYYPDITCGYGSAIPYGNFQYINILDIVLVCGKISWTGVNPVVNMDFTFALPKAPISNWQTNGMGLAGSLIMDNPAVVLQGGYVKGNGATKSAKLELAFGTGLTSFSVGFHFTYRMDND